MFRKLIVLFVLFSVAFVVQGQGLKAVTQHHKPGDTLRYRVEFDGDPKFDGVSLGSYLQGNSRADQPRLSGYFAIGHITKVRPGVYDLDGTIPPNAPDGGPLGQRRARTGIEAILCDRLKDHNSSGQRRDVRLPAAEVDQVPSDSAYLLVHLPSS